MRLSIYNNSTPLMLRAVVYLDGVEQKRCTIADEEEGYIERYIPQEQIPHGAIDWPQERVYGVVKIVDPLEV